MEKLLEKLSVNGIHSADEVRGDGPPLLLLHGFFGSSGDWVHLFDSSTRWRSAGAWSCRMRAATGD